ncbi:hypothetical protein BH10BDE1_BH10BDE1_35690 [soil metagenome]
MASAIFRIEEIVIAPRSSRSFFDPKASERAIALLLGHRIDVRLKRPNFPLKLGFLFERKFHPNAIRKLQTCANLQLATPSTASKTDSGTR